MAQALPDPIGGAGYANIFQGSQAVDDWRDDLKYNRFRKAKAAEDEAARIAKISTKVDPLLGWANRDQPELNKMYEVIQKQALDLKMQGKDPFSDLDFLTKAQKAKGLAAASLEHQKTYEGGLKELDALFKTGAITPETYAQKQQEWENFGMGGGAVKNGVGGIYSRTQMDAPQNPATIPDMLAFIKDNQTILESKKKEVSYPTADGMQKTIVEVPEEEVKKQLELMRNVPMWKRFTDEQKATIEDAIGFGRKDATKPLAKGGALEFSFGGGGAGGNKDYQVTYAEFVPKGTQESGLQMAEMQPTDSFEFIGEVPKRNISNLQVITVADENGTQSQKTVQGIDDFIPLRIYKQDGKFIAEGTGIYEDNGVKKQSDMSFVIEGKTNRNLIERNYFGGNDLDESLKKMKGEVAPKTKNEPVNISTKAEFDKLPKGTQFYRNGQLMIKQ